ncbi:hypothetical protein E0765_04745 [Sulfuricurvum sp. IAE1]|uniref:hypothetical protein n=1 Tax=Sulfuricurvum sp. IAE1 TaxID=2546102 RepID=UPI00104A49F0|nr:hypothetical protein [Sulfuricurvum sp. IAE1]TDA65793.1 hypothetical protein E0765_04745 [Sulfuricurvum sp. IAE1]
MRMTKEQYAIRLTQIASQKEIEPIENLIAMTKLQQEYIESLEEHNAVQKDIIEQYQRKDKYSCDN